jgi:hypothetical protein
MSKRLEDHPSPGLKRRESRRRGEQKEQSRKSRA